MRVPRTMTRCLIPHPLDPPAHPPAMQCAGPSAPKRELARIRRGCPAPRPSPAHPPDMPCAHMRGPQLPSASLHASAEDAPHHDRPQRIHLTCRVRTCVALRHVSAASPMDARRRAGGVAAPCPTSARADAAARSTPRAFCRRHAHLHGTPCTRRWWKWRVEQAPSPSSACSG